MTMIQTQFFEKKYRSFFDGTAPEFQGQNFPYILFFQVNHINSKEWIDLKKTFHMMSPSTIHHMIPKRFLVQILQPHVFPEPTQSIFSFMEQTGFLLSKDGLPIDSMGEASFKQGNSLQSQGPLQGHSCFFFCQTLNEVQHFFQNYDVSKSQQSPYGEEPLMLSKSLWTKAQQKRFRPLGMLEKIKNPLSKTMTGLVSSKPVHGVSSKNSDFSLIFWNTYDIQKILHVTSQNDSPHQQFLNQVLYPTMTQPLQMLHSFCTSSFNPFLYHQYAIYNLLRILSLKKETK
jgi:hypothetical protein